MGKEFTLSKQMQATIMMILQKGLVEQRDVTEMLSELRVISEDDELFVTNPPKSLGLGGELEKAEEEKPLILTGDE